MLVPGAGPHGGCPMIQAKVTLGGVGFGGGWGALVFSLVMVLGACGGGTSSSAEKSTATAPTTKAASGQTPVFIDIETCDNNGGNGNATGTIENQGTTATAYRLRVGFYDSATNKLLAEGTVDTATIQPGATGDWKITASGLGSADTVCHTLGVEQSVAGAGGTTTTTGADAAAEFPCNLISQQEIEQLAGNPLDRGDASTDHVTEDTANWTALECAWLKPGAQNPTEVTLAVSRAADFPEGSVQCPPSPASSTVVTGLGEQALWSWTDTGTTITVGKLRVCADNALVDVTVDSAASGDAHLAIARGVAEKALAAL
jgi:hypothetical protein